MKKPTTQVNFGITSAIFCLICALAYCVIHKDFDPVWLGIYFGWCLCFAISCLIECNLFKVFQILLFIVIAGICFKFSNNKIYGMAPMMVAFLVCYKYGVYNNHPIIKLVLSFIISTSVLVCAIGLVIDVAIWVLFMTAFNYYIWMVCDGIKENANNFARAIQAEIKRLADDIRNKGVDQ